MKYSPPSLLRSRLSRLSAPLAFLVCLLPALVFSGCNRPRQVDVAAAEGILLVGNGPDPATLDPHGATSIGALQVNLALREGLVRFDRETLEPLPGLAERWAIAPDGRRITFFLRPGAQWSDGTPLTAADVVASWERLLNPALGSGNAPLLYVVTGAEAYHRGATDDFSSVGVRPVGLMALEVQTVRPARALLDVAMHPALAPVPLRALEAMGGRYDRANPWSRQPHPVNGPFQLVAWQDDVAIEVTRNPLYHAAGAIALNGIRFRAFAEPATEERAFRAGQLHVTDALPPARVPALREQQDPALVMAPYLGTYYVLFNHRAGPLGDPRVRAALAAAIDRDALVTQLLGAGQTVATQFTPPALLGGHAESPSSEAAFDPAAARAHLAAAGFADGAGFPSLTYLFNTSESHRQIGEALQAMWREHLGIEVRLENVEWRTYLARRASGDFEMARAVWIADYPGASSFLALWRSGAPNNWAGWRNAVYDDALSLGLSTGDPQIQRGAFLTAEATLRAETVIVPLYHYTTSYLVDPRVEGWAGNPLDWPDFHAVRFFRPGEP